MTLEEVKRFLDYVAPDWYDYFLLRFMTGMRSCEVHELQLKHIDFEHRLINIRQNMVNGDITDVKTPKSRRDLPINDLLLTAIKRITAPSQILMIFCLPMIMARHWIPVKLVKIFGIQHLKKPI